MYLRGPIIDHWPTRTQKEMIGGSEFDPKHIIQNLKNFLARAYRRPPTDEQIQSLDQIYTFLTSNQIFCLCPSRKNGYWIF